MYSRSDCGLTEVPVDIPETAESVLLMNNNIHRLKSKLQTNIHPTGDQPLQYNVSLQYVNHDHVWKTQLVHFIDGLSSVNGLEKIVCKEVIR